MKKTRLITVSLWAVVLMLLAAPGKGTAGVQVSIGLAAPFPAVIVPQPVAALPHSPRHVAVPKTDSYYYPLDSDSLYYDGYWYRPRGRAWYRATSYDGPWGYIATHRMPRAVIILPAGDHWRWQDRRHDYDDRHDHRHGRHWGRPRYHDHRD